MRPLPTRRARPVLLALAALVAATGAPAASAAETDAALTSYYPWSGYWWPHAKGGLTGPLARYDQLTGSNATRWEYDHHVAANPEPWFGHCHAWSASCIVEREPRAPRTVGGVTFGVGDQKGLLAACHAQDASNFYGDRFGDGEGSEDRADLPPDELWRLLQLYVRRQRIPLVLDLEAGPEVWNHPVYQYEVKFQPTGPEGLHDATMTIVVADDGVTPDYLGTQYKVHVYTFRVKMRNGAFVLGSGRWTGKSVQDHPDFAWYPYVARAENPGVAPDKVGQIVGYQIGSEHPPTGDGDGPSSPATPTTPSGPATPTTPSSPATPPGEGRPDVATAPAPIDQTLDPYELAEAIVNRTSKFLLDLTVDRGDGGKYQAGEHVALTVRSGEPGYLYLFDVDPEGRLALVFPRVGQPNRIEGDRLYELPARGAPALLTAQGPGAHVLKGIVTAKPLRISGTRLGTQVQQVQQRGPRQGQARPPEPDQGPGQVQGPGQAPDQEPFAPQTQRAPNRSGQGRQIVLHPSAERQMWQQIRQGVQRQGGQTGEQGPPSKLGRFAQDACTYFVLSGKNPGQQGRQGQQDQDR